MDFYNIKRRRLKNGTLEIYPDFKVTRSKDIMVRGKSFYAIWDEELGLWSTDEYDVQRIIDADLEKEASKVNEENLYVRYMSEYSSKSWESFRSYVSHISDNARQLDEKITFSNTVVGKTDYVSKRLPYPIQDSTIDAYEELMSTLYDPEERAKIEWAIGSIISGDSKIIQKFIVLYGASGAGKSTVLNIIQKLFEGYYTTFEAKALASSSNTFSTEVFKSNPLVAIQHDGDLSRIEDNSKLNSIISHEEMTMHEKYKASYMSRLNCFLFMATNKPVKITDAKSGIIRRLIDVRPSGRRLPPERYYALMGKINFELSGIASHCLNVYSSMGKEYYNEYVPIDMMFKTDIFYNFVEDSYEVFNREDGIGLKAAFAMYKKYCDDSGTEYRLPMYKFREELKNYFVNFEDRHVEGNVRIRSYFSGFRADKFHRFVSETKEVEVNQANLIEFNQVKSIFDEECADCVAQYASTAETPKQKWEEVTTTLKDIDTSKLHYVKVPENHIVIDFDLKEDGEKSFSRNLEEASKWPKTYSELSKSGKGIHLHYIYDGDPKKLSRIYADDIEIKVFSGNSSLRRKLSMCNDSQIAHISSGLPLKGEKVIKFDSIKNEKALRTLLKKNLAKEIHSSTKSSVDFIYKILEEAYESGISYDVTDLRPSILAFANGSTNQAQYCVKLVSKMHFHSEDISETTDKYDMEELVFFDVEVFPNLFVVVWKAENGSPVKMINPSSSEIEELTRMKLVGFNCRRYDNHILYARLLGYNNYELYILSQRIISGSKNGFFGDAYNLSYTDVYDFSSKKQSLKKFEIELGIHHQELGIKWDEPVPENLWVTVADYCVNDVIATEAVFNDRKQDFIARQILADMSGLSVNDTTQAHTARIIFGKEKNPQKEFVYTDLSEMFPGYIFDAGHSFYKGEDPGEGGYVYSEPGMYKDVALLDIESMHPNSIIQLNLFGPYTQNFKDILDARLAIKHKDYDTAKKLLNGRLTPYLGSDEDSEALAYSLKIIINIVYGLTSAKFDNKFRDPRNIDNIVAKRGSLFMIDLKNAVQEKGYTVAHIKTDSIKIPNADLEIIKFVKEFGKKYGYNFEHEATYERMCLVNNAVYIARTIDGDWTATGAQFQHPYVFKKLFTKEPIEFSDLCETKTVSTALYLDMNEENEDEHIYQFVGKAGSFCPIKPGCGGGLLLREKDGKYDSATGAKGYRWLESEVVTALNKEQDVDYGYFNKLCDDAVDVISKYCDFEEFTEPINWVPWKED